MVRAGFAVDALQKSLRAAESVVVFLRGSARPSAHGHWAADADGTPDLVTYWTFESNGTWTVDQRDYATDVPNDSIVVNGTARTCYRSLETYSSECNQLKARLPAPPSGLECRLDRGQMTLLVSWNFMLCQILQQYSPGTPDT